MMILKVGTEGMSSRAYRHQCQKAAYGRLLVSNRTTPRERFSKSKQASLEMFIVNTPRKCLAEMQTGDVKEEHRERAQDG
jgi:hypothetical protein